VSFTNQCLIWLSVRQSCITSACTQ